MLHSKIFLKVFMGVIGTDNSGTIVFFVNWIFISSCDLKFDESNFHKSKYQKYLPTGNKHQTKQNSNTF